MGRQKVSQMTKADLRRHSQDSSSEYQDQATARLSRLKGQDKHRAEKALEIK